MKELHCPLIVNQRRYSIFDRTIEKDGVKSFCRESGMGIIAFSPLAQGLLTDKYLHGIPEDSRIARDGRFLHASDLTDAKLKKISLLNDLASLRGQTLAQMALSWILKDGDVCSVLIGASRPEQILENVSVHEKAEFSEEELRKIEEICGEWTYAAGSALSEVHPADQFRICLEIPVFIHEPVSLLLHVRQLRIAEAAYIRKLPDGWRQFPIPCQIFLSGFGFFSIAPSAVPVLKGNASVFTDQDRLSVIAVSLRQDILSVLKERIPAFELRPAFPVALCQRCPASRIVMDRDHIRHRMLPAVIGNDRTLFGIQRLGQRINLFRELLLPSAAVHVRDAPGFIERRPGNDAGMAAVLLHDFRPLLPEFSGGCFRERIAGRHLAPYQQSFDIAPVKEPFVPGLLMLPQSAEAESLHAVKIADDGCFIFRRQVRFLPVALIQDKPLIQFLPVQQDPAAFGVGLPPLGIKNHIL